MNDICYENEYFQDGVYLNSFDCVVVHKNVRYTNKTEIKDGLRYISKKKSLPGDIVVFKPED